MCKSSADEATLKNLKSIIFFDPRDTQGKFWQSIQTTPEQNLAEDVH